MESDAFNVLSLKNIFNYGIENDWEFAVNMSFHFWRIVSVLQNSATADTGCGGSDCLERATLNQMMLRMSETIQPALWFWMVLIFSVPRIEKTESCAGAFNSSCLDTGYQRWKMVASNMFIWIDKTFISASAFDNRLMLRPQTNKQHLFAYCCSPKLCSYRKYQEVHCTIASGEGILGPVPLAGASSRFQYIAKYVDLNLGEVCSAPSDMLGLEPWILNVSFISTPSPHCGMCRFAQDVWICLAWRYAGPLVLPCERFDSGTLQNVGICHWWRPARA